MATVDLSVQPRSDTGKGVARKLRAAASVPAVVYGPGRDPRPVAISATELRHAISTSAGERVVMKIAFAGEKKSGDIMAIIKDIQRHPVSRAFLHADLLAVKMDEPIEVPVPVRGEGVPEGVKTENGVLEWMRRDLVILVLPGNIPDSIVLDVSHLHVGQGIHVSDIPTDNFEFVVPGDTPVCQCAATRMSLEVVDEGEEGEPVEGAEGEDADADAPESSDSK